MITSRIMPFGEKQDISLADLRAAIRARGPVCAVFSPSVTREKILFWNPVEYIEVHDWHGIPKETRDAIEAEAS